MLSTSADLKSRNYNSRSSSALNMLDVMQTIPAWMRTASGVLGFLTSFLLVGLPAIALIIIDRIIPSGTSDALGKLFLLGATTVLSVSLIEIMRMKALERYVVNVRGVIFLQDSCFALFWAAAISFVHPLLAIPSVLSAALLFITWKFRKPLQKEALQTGDLPDFDSEKVDACGLGPAFYEMAAKGRMPFIQQLDFQTLGQSFTTSLLKRIMFVVMLSLTAWLTINTQVSLGTAIAAIFLNQLNLEVFIRCFQVQSLRTPRYDVHHIEKILEQRQKKTKTPDDLVGMDGLLSIEGLKADGFTPFSADIFPGLCLAFIGPSGCGKSRILKAVATRRFEAGHIKFGDKNLDRFDQNSHLIGYVPPSPINLPGTFVENVIGFDPQADQTAALDLILQLDPYEDVFRDEDLLNDPLQNNFSAQGQIVSIARALYKDTSILILDTPELFLDKASKAALLALILKAKTDGKIVLLATDDDHLMTAADEVIKLDRGTITDRGPVDEVLSRHHERWVRVSFRPTKRDAFRLGLWLDTQLGQRLPEALRDRIKTVANDLLFLAPRNQFGGQEAESIFDLKVGLDCITLSLHDKGELIDISNTKDNEKPAKNLETARIFAHTDDFQQKLQEGYRQITIRFDVNPSNISKPKAAEG